MRSPTPARAASRSWPSPSAGPMAPPRKRSSGTGSPWRPSCSATTDIRGSTSRTRPATTRPTTTRCGTSSGQPQAAYSDTGGVYQRTFAAGKVLVNPGDTSVTVALGGTYTDLDGQTVSSVTMAPHTGQVVTG